MDENSRLRWVGKGMASAVPIDLLLSYSRAAGACEESPAECSDQKESTSRFLGTEVPRNGKTKVPITAGLKVVTLR